MIYYSNAYFQLSRDGDGGSKNMQEHILIRKPDSDRRITQTRL